MLPNYRIFHFLSLINQYLVIKNEHVEAIAPITKYNNKVVWSSALTIPKADSIKTKIRKKGMYA